MNPVVGWCDQDIFEPTHLINQFGVDEDPPDLGGGVYEYDIERFESEPRQRDEIYEPVQGLEDGGAEPNGEVHFFGGVMGDVYGPEEADLVIPAMQPIIQEVFGQQQQEPVGEDIGDGYPAVGVTELKDEQVDAAEQEVDSAIQQHQIQTAQRVFERIEPAVPKITEEDLQSDDEKI